MKYIIRTSKQFRKDLRNLGKREKDLKKIRKVIWLLENGKTLHPSYRDYKLKGSIRNNRECHIEPDWLLLYEKDDNELLLLLIKTGNHKHVLNIE